jgi:MFS family permease
LPAANAALRVVRVKGMRIRGLMTTTNTHLIHQRRFLPLFVTQLLGAFNDNLYKNAMLLFVVYSIYNSEASEARFSAIASGLFILPFFLLSALAGQLADMRDKARLIRIVKACEVAIMLVGGAGLLLAWHRFAVDTVSIPLMLAALLAMGIHSTFFGPIKYAILPQHLAADEVLAGTGLVEAGTYIAILAGTILAGFISVQWAAAVVVATAVIGLISAQAVPPAPPVLESQPIDLHIVRASIRLVRATTHHPRVFLAIAAISVFWAVGAVLFIQFPPLAKNVLGASKSVSSLFLVIFSVGVAIGSVSVNRLLDGKVSARYAPASVMVMAAFIVAFDLVCRQWPPHEHGQLLDALTFVHQPLALPLLATLLGIAVAGGMFVVPLYAFLTTVVDKSETSRTIAANNIVNSGAMVVGSVLAVSLSALGVAIVHQLLLGAALCTVSAYLGWKLYQAEQAHLGEIEHTF